MKNIEDIRNIRVHTLLGIKDNGRRQKIRCPFHADRTPSFVVYPDNSWHCFGCEKNGQNAIDFCMALGFTFSEAIAELETEL